MIIRKPWLLATALSLCLASIPSQALEGKVVDADTNAAIADAIVTLGNDVVRTDKDGHFKTQASADRVLARAPGYRATAIAASDFAKAGNVTQLHSFRPKALYLSAFTMAYAPKRTADMQLIQSTGLNAVVVDLKNDEGLVDYPTSVALASTIGARRVTTMHNLAATVAHLHEQQLYAIARIVVFKDRLVANTHPEWSVKMEDGSVYHDHEGSTWVDPFFQEHHDYVVALAVEAAQAGFDEIQFDYIRFPDARGLKFSQPNTESNRIGAITALLTQARTALIPYNVFLAADAFGYTSWNTDDTRIGQHLEDMLSVVDYLSLMLYPSGFQFGIPGYLDPVSHPYEIVHLSLDHAETRAKVPGIRFRPWLQNFRDYAFDHRSFGADEVAAQVRAADDSGTDGWMLWNPRNIYTYSPMQTSAK